MTRFSTYCIYGNGLEFAKQQKFLLSQSSAEQWDMTTWGQLAGISVVAKFPSHRFRKMSSNLPALAYRLLNTRRASTKGVVVRTRLVESILSYASRTDEETENYSANLISTFVRARATDKRQIVELRLSNFRT